MITEKQMLYNYLYPLLPRYDWGEIDKKQVMTFARERLADLRGDFI